MLTKPKQSLRILAKLYIISDNLPIEKCRRDLKISNFHISGSGYARFNVWT